MDERLEVVTRLPSGSTCSVVWKYRRVRGAVAAGGQSGAMAHTTVEMSGEVRLRRLEHFVRRVGYLRRHMAPGEQALLNALVEGAPEEFWLATDQAIDRERAADTMGGYAMTPGPLDPDGGRRGD